LLKYLIRRTDITLLVSNIRFALAAHKICPTLRGTIEYLLDYTLGLVECIWDVEDLPQCPTRILQWLILSYGGAGAWNKFAQIVQRDIKTATSVIENRKVDAPYPGDLERMINDLSVYSNMLSVSMEYERHGGPVLNEEEDELRGVRWPVERHVPTTKQERLAFRLDRALRELNRMKDGLVNAGYSLRPEDCKLEHQVQPKANVQARNDQAAPGPFHGTGHHNETGCFIIQDCPTPLGIPAATARANSAVGSGLYPMVSQVETVRENFLRRADAQSSVRKEMESLSKSLQRVLELQEQLSTQLQSDKSDLATSTCSGAVQQPEPQNSLENSKERPLEAMLEINSISEQTIECGREVIRSMAEEDKGDKRAAVLTTDTSASVPSPGAPYADAPSPSGSYVLFTPAGGDTPTGWCLSPSSIIAAGGSSPEQPEENHGSLEKPDNRYDGEIEW
jgi:hypothetical protein